MQHSLLVQSSLPLVMLTKYYQDVLRGANSVLKKGKKKIKKKSGHLFKINYLFKKSHDMYHSGA